LKYCHSSRLIINYDKCCYIEFGSNRNAGQNQKYFLGILNNGFRRVEKCKFLGVYINQNLSWDDQINHVLMIVSKSCGTLFRVRLQVPRKILKQVYMALVQPYLNYCISLWGFSTSSCVMSKIFVLQKSASVLFQEKLLKKTEYLSTLSHYLKI
jgi:hypothetical protein